MQVVSASTTVKFHEFPSGTVLHNYQPGTTNGGPIRSISWSKEGNWLALVPATGQPEIVSIKDQLKLIHTIQGVTDPACASFQNTTKKNIAIGTSDGSVLVYDIKARNIRKHFPKSNFAISHIEFTSKDSHLVAACTDGTAFIYSNITNNLVGTLKVPRSESITAMRTNPIKRNYVVAGSKNGVVAVWDINTNKNKFFVGSHKAPVSAVVFSTINANLVVSAGLDRQFCFYDIESNKCIANIFVENYITALDFSPDGKFIVMGSQNGEIHVYDIKNIQQPMHSFVAHSSAIKHIQFRKAETKEQQNDDNSDYSVTDIAKSSSEVPENQRNLSTTPLFDFNISTKTTPTESFTRNYGSATNQSYLQQNSCANLTNDSFMAALGRNNKSPVDETNANQVWLNDELDPKPPHMTFNVNAKKDTADSTPVSASRILIEKNKRFTSTPNYEVLTPIQPTCTSLTKTCFNNTPVTASDETIRALVKSVGDIQEDLKLVTSQMKELKTLTMQTAGQTRGFFLDLIMQNVKESMKIEKQFNALCAEMPQFQAGNMESLLDENFILKQRIATLENELAGVKNNDRDSF